MSAWREVAAVLRSQFRGSETRHAATRQGDHDDAGSGPFEVHPSHGGSQLEARSARQIGVGWLASRISAGARVGVTRNIAPELVSLPDGFITRFNRADDEARFYLRPRVTTLITPKMLGQSMHHYD